MTSTASTGTRVTRWLGVATLATFGLLVLLSLALSPDDAIQGEAVRFLYLHVPMVTLMYVGFGISAASSVAYLWKRTLGWDRLAGAAAEVGVLLTALGLFTGMLWGRTTWGVYWTWDARLTSTALLFVLELGYLAVRRLPASFEARARRSAYVALLAFVDVPIVHWSVDWWNGLHQKRTLNVRHASINGLMLFTLFVGFVAMTLGFTWLLIHRYRLAQLEDLSDEHELEAAIEQRHAEALLLDVPHRGATA